MISNGKRHLKNKPLGGARTHRTQSRVYFTSSPAIFEIHRFSSGFGEYTPLNFKNQRL
uniref:Uncharacterized protein n=1 Tax=Myoviridae sp. ctniE2 TaxID=2825172 RepID=A0A8S5PJM0_9CAUD|nr:MAG TPA: hypothetical protein [Myoviridae sp. ctniE2]DAS90833.1 MAG TPA: hypothetical protein [Caudoviricetes sp.]DAV12324.1 MAG TPA: hypothetical protein [Caudoviricetes sp.]DAX99787.1 MAG TPA: hypothetical protein [Caudoviricetes sp.]DAY28572.1 MAG TPA: hypothetical protein [Caudoviricetes sp.]